MKIDSGRLNYCFGRAASVLFTKKSQQPSFFVILLEIPLIIIPERKLFKAKFNYLCGKHEQYGFIDQKDGPAVGFTINFPCFVPAMRNSKPCIGHWINGLFYGTG
jgi:hypothetical protein